LQVYTGYLHKTFRWNVAGLYPLFAYGTGLSMNFLLGN